MAEPLRLDDGELDYIRGQLGKAKEMLAAGVPCDPKDIGLLRCLATIDALRAALENAYGLLRSAAELNKTLCATSKEDTIAVTSWFAELTKLRAERAWQPIDTAPRDGSRVLVWDGQPAFATDIRELLGKESAQWRDDEGSAIEPSHWMPLPEAPR